VANAAHPAGSGETRHVTDHAATESEQDAITMNAGGSQRIPDACHRLQALVRFAGRKNQRTGMRQGALHDGQPMPCDILIRHHQCRLPGELTEQFRGSFQQPGAGEDAVAAAGVIHDEFVHGASSSRSLSMISPATVFTWRASVLTTRWAHSRYSGSRIS